MITFLGALSSIVNFYTLLIIVYVLMSWFPHEKGFMKDVYHVLETICEPYLGLFRKLIPPLGGVDITPIVAVIVLELAMRLIVSVLT